MEYQDQELINSWLMDNIDYKVFNGKTVQYLLIMLLNKGVHAEIIHEEDSTSEPHELLVCGSGCNFNKVMSKPFPHSIQEIVDHYYECELNQLIEMC